MPDDVLTHARTWLQRQGYPLEFSVARTLRSVGYHIEQGRHWIDEDPETGASKAREIDVVATETSDANPPSDDNGQWFIRIVVECKHARFPWMVLMADPATPAPAIPGALLGNFDPSTAIWPKHQMPWHFRISGPFGFNVVEMREADDRPGRDARNAAYDAIVAATRGAWRLLRERTLLVLPVVVTDSPLLSLSYDEDGVEKVERRPMVRVVWSGSPLHRLSGPSGRPILRSNPVLVDVVQSDSFAKYALMWRRSTHRVLSRITI
jgi:hypothetical protein